jgi:regulator of protease activity HflC (stomatin/prohibitin superfamily)
MSEEIKVVNMKVTCADVPPQAVMTADNLTVNIDAVCYYEVFDARKAVFSIDNYHFALSNLAQVTLRTVLGEHTLKEIFSERPRINQRLKELVDEASDPWGIKVGRVEMKAIEIDDTMQRAMAATAEAQQEAEAKIIQAKAQRDAASILSDAAQIMRTEPNAMQLQWFETLRIIVTQGKNKTIVLPSSADANGLLAAAASATTTEIGQTVQVGQVMQGYRQAAVAVDSLA